MVQLQYQGEILFRPSRPDSIETDLHSLTHGQWTELFRPSRPDSIETPILVPLEAPSSPIVPAI